MRSDAAAGFSRQVHKHNLGHGRVPSVFEKLLCKLRSALADGHGSQCTVACVRIGTENHVSAGRHLLACVRVNYGLVCGNVNSAVFFCSGKSEHMVVLVYRAADGAQAVVAIGKRIGHRELLHSGSTRLLDNADICDIMRHKRVKCDFELLGVARSVVCLQDFVCHGLAACLRRRHRNALTGNAVHKVHAVLNKFDH